MSSTSPPDPNVNLFNNLYWITGDEFITQSQADKRYLRYPVAQGTENLQAINVNGVAQFNNDINVGSSTTANLFPEITTYKSQLNLGSGGQGEINIECAVDIGGFGSLNLTTADINLTADATIQQSGSTTTNTLGLTNIQTSNGVSATPNLKLTDTISGNYTDFLTNSGNGSFNPASSAGNQVIVASGTKNTEVLELTTWSDTNAAVVITHNSASIGAGGASTIPTSSVVCNGTSVVVNPQLQFPDNRVQNSAFTGGGAFAGSYTLSNITLDSNGKITAISNGSATSQFQPTFHNFANYQTGTSGYSQGAYINWSSGWGALDYVMIRVRAQVNWSISSGEYNNYATTAGELIIRPYYAPAGVIGSLSSPNIFWSTNSGSVVGNVKKLIYYTGAINNGTQSYFFVYGNGGSGGGSSGYIQLMCDAPGTSGGWQYTCSYEYIIHSTSGASITFSNGVGTNNSLP